MLSWLLRKLQRKSTPAIRTLHDLFGAIRNGSIRPRVYRVGVKQVVNLFAGTRLSKLERKKVLMRSFGFPAGMCMYVHKTCADSYLAGLPARDHGVFEPRTREWSPTELIGLYGDITHCDHCGGEFQPTDEGYVAYWVVPLEDLRLFTEVQREQSSGTPA
jgi:hypothetical protein